MSKNINFTTITHSMYFQRRDKIMKPNPRGITLVVPNDKANISKLYTLMWPILRNIIPYSIQRSKIFINQSFSFHTIRLCHLNFTIIYSNFELKHEAVEAKVEKEKWPWFPPPRSPPLTGLPPYKPTWLQRSPVSNRRPLSRLPRRSTVTLPPLQAMVQESIVCR